MTARLPEVLASRVARVEYVGCPADPLHRSRFVRDSTPVGSHDRCERFTVALIADTALIARLPDWTLWGSDMDLIRVARSALPTADKLRILPARTERGLTMLGSKTGLATLSRELGLPQPPFEVAETRADLQELTRQWRPAYVLKGERGGGSSRIRCIATDQSLQQDPVPDHWLPVLVQELVEGTEIAVDAMFNSGRLVAWTYAETTDREGAFGLSTARRYCDPASEDFAETLTALGVAAGLHGLANCTFIRSEGVGGHLLVECDMRANAWFQFGPTLGIDWGTHMTHAPSDPLPVARPRFGPGRDAVVHLYPRQLVHAFTALSWSDAQPWLTRAPGTWDLRCHRDRVVNAAERQEIWDEVSRLPGRALRRIWRIT